MKGMMLKDLIREAKQKAENTGIYNAHRLLITKDEFAEYLTALCQTVIYERNQENKFVIDKYNRDVIAMLYQYTDIESCVDINPSIGIILTGKYGCGKSVLMSGFCRMLNALNINKKEAIREYHAIELTELILKDGIKDFVKRPLLIQDIGKEPKIVKDFGNDKNPLRELLMARCEFGSLTYGTTNYNKDIFERAYPDFPMNPEVKVTTTSKRLFEHVNFITLKGENRRKSYIYG